MAWLRADRVPQFSDACIPPAILGTARLATAAMQGSNHIDRARMIEDCDPSPVAGLYDMSVSYQIAARREEALRLQDVAVAASPLFRVRRERPGSAGLRLLALVAPGDLMVNTPLDFVTNFLDVQLDVLFLVPGVPLPDVIPEHDVMFFAVSTADDPMLARMQRLYECWPRPVMNDPRFLPGLARDALSRSLQHVPGLCSPVTVEVSREQLERQFCGAGIGELLPGCTYPVLLRPLGSHAGAGLEKLDGPGDLARYLVSSPDTAFYLSAFVDYRDGAGMYRKYRVAFIGGAPHLCHMAISENWMVHYLNAGMTESSVRRDEEARAMAEFGAFAARHADAFAALHRRLPFDYYSIDCSELPDGRLLVFEADTAAIIHLMDPEEMFPYKHRHMTAVFRAFGDMLAGRAQTSRAQGCGNSV